MSTCWFDPRSAFHKTPFGAVTTGAVVRFRVAPEEPAAVVRCTLLARDEFSDVWTETPLAPETADGRAVFSGAYTAPDAPTLVWYHFRLTWADGSESCCAQNGLCAWTEVQPWQLTVYDGAAFTPDWFGRGVTYQIFPDRFRRAQPRAVAGMVGCRTLHARWDEAPDYLPNAAGEYCTDFFGGDLAGIAEKLDYLASLGVTTIYLNPIFEAAANHRYNTADYRRIDPLLGTEDDFRALCAQARARGIRILLDGVFNHTGSDSVYFNQNGTYPSLGAAQSRESPYADWYRFTDFPNEYDAWWGIRTLPAVEETSESYVNFIVDGEDSVVRHWLRAGASGWRLDVADELPDWFIAKIRRAVAQESPDAFLLGEVWEDGSNKIAYSQRRRYLLGGETHGLMNYPFRSALLAYLRGGDARDFRDAMETLREHYPAPAYYSAMNFLSTHDTPRILTALGLAGEAPADKGERARSLLNGEELYRGLARLRLGALVMFAFPGSPTIYYGDEAGMQGFEDPFNRGTYPWGREDHALVAWFARLGALRRSCAALQSGGIEYLCADGPLLAFARTAEGGRVVAACNAGETDATLTLPWPGAAAQDALTGRRFSARDGALALTLAPCEGMLLLGS